MDFQTLNSLDNNSSFSVVNEYDYDEDDYFDEFYDDIIFNEEKDIPALSVKPKKTRSKSNILNVDPLQTVWYIAYLLKPKVGIIRFDRLFRRRFRMPYSSFIDLLNVIKSDHTFRRWHDGNKDCVKKACSPIGLLLLGSLRYLGRGFTFDDLFEATGISEEVHRNFFHTFIKWGSSTLYNMYVKPPFSVEEAQQNSSEYTMAGLNGAIGSMDGVHILMERCESQLANEHISHKMKQTARAFNVIVNNRRRILHCTKGYPCRLNDKSLLMRDTFAMDLQFGRILSDYEFYLYERSSGNQVRSVKYNGCWLVVDNGYLDWSTNIPPFTVSNFIPEIRFSEWLESIRKDVECTFGILKGRWRILKTGIRIHGTQSCDDIFKTCCALHNLLLEVDGIDNESNWLGDWGLHNSVDDVINNINPYALLRLRSPAQVRSYDTSTLGTNCIITNTERKTNDNQQYEVVEGDSIVRNMSLISFRQKLVEHFDIMYERKALQWPRLSKHKPNIGRIVG